MAASTVDAVVTRLVNTKELSIPQYMESLGPRLLSEDDMEREQALNELVDVILRLPHSFLIREQVGLLLQFLIGRLESSALIGGNVIEGIKHLILTSPNLPDNFEITAFQSLFRDGNIQSWPQKERSKYYDILEWMFNNKTEELKPLGSDLVMSFIRAVGGERDPRCLIRVFRLFVIVANNFDLGPFAEDMFEVVACYFPVEFKPLPDQNSITRELLSSACISCLVAHASFAPFCYIMIDEKLEDEETSFDQKLEIFALLTIACERLPVTSLLPYLETTLAVIRSVALDPNHKGDVPSQSMNALLALMKAISKLGKDKLNALVSSMVENMEPFILQAEMGLCSRGLRLLRTLVEASSENSTIVIDRTLSWIISLVQGTTVNAAANRGDICREGLEYLGDWVELATEKEEKTILSTMESTILASLDEARQITASEAVICLYRCIKSYLLSGAISDAIGLRCDEILTRSLNTVESEKERKYLFDLLSANASKRQEAHFSLLAKLSGTPTIRLSSILCASVVDINSTEYFMNQLPTFFGDEPVFNWDSFMDMLRRLKTVTSNQSLVDRMSESIFDLVILYEARLADDVSIHIQTIGLLISNEKHSELEAKYYVHQSKTILRFFFAQSVDCDFLVKAVESQTNVDLQKIFAAGVINRMGSTSAVENLFGTEKWFPLISAKSLLLAGKPHSLVIVKQILWFFKEENITLLDFNSPEWNPERCKYKTTALWRHRILCQVLPIYLCAVEADKENVALLTLLPSILTLADQIGPTSHSLVAQLLPVFLATFELGQSYECLLPALPAFLINISKDQLNAQNVTKITTGLNDFIENNTSDLINVMNCLNSLETIARRAEVSTTLPLVGQVEKSTTCCLGHKKRIIRQKAAAVKNTWETIVTK